MNNYKVVKIENFIANDFIKNFHYLHSYPTEIKNRKFGLYENENLIGVCSFGACVSWRLTFNSINKISPKYFIELKPIEEISFLTNESRKWNTLKKSILDKKYKPGIYFLLQEVLNLKKGKKTNLQNLKYSNKLMKLIRKIYFD